MTSTMKSELGLPTRCGISFGTLVSAAICCTEGCTAEGSRLTSAAVVPGVAALAAVADAVAPATATPARNFRRLTSGRGSFLAIRFLLLIAAPQRGVLDGLSAGGGLGQSWVGKPD